MNERNPNLGARERAVVAGLHVVVPDDGLQCCNQGLQVEEPRLLQQALMEKNKGGKIEKEKKGRFLSF